jgi:hypothetical protein
LPKLTAGSQICGSFPDVGKFAFEGELGRIYTEDDQSLVFIRLVPDFQVGQRPYSPVRPPESLVRPVPLKTGAGVFAPETVPLMAGVVLRVMVAAEAEVPFL